MNLIDGIPTVRRKRLVYLPLLIELGRRTVVSQVVV